MKMLMKGLALLVALLMCAAYAARTHGAGARHQEKPERKESETISDEQLAHAKTLFQERCARCHGADGRGETMLGGMLGVPNFTDEKWWTEEKNDARLTVSITAGKGEMPAFGKKFSRQEIGALVHYVRGFVKTHR